MQVQVQVEFQAQVEVQVHVGKWLKSTPVGRRPWALLQDTFRIIWSLAILRPVGTM
jgi:antitoxin component of MazEF toxin-antitoxin module